MGLILRLILRKSQVQFLAKSKFFGTVLKIRDACEYVWTNLLTENKKTLLIAIFSFVLFLQKLPDDKPEVSNKHPLFYVPYIY